MRSFAILSLVIAPLLAPAVADAAEDVIVVYDASGSMWGQIDRVSKIEIARDVMADLVENWSDEIGLGLVAYGHRKQGDCNDIETVIAPALIDRRTFMNTIGRIQPVGKTPLSAAVKHAADVLSYRDNPATVVLISDGIESCQADPCALSAKLAERGVKFTAHVIGFDLEADNHGELACIAENTGGIFVAAQDAAELHDAIAQVQNVIDLQPMPTPQPAPEPVIEPAPEADIVITAPEQITVGAAFPVSWSETINSTDYVGIVPTGSDEGERGNYIVVRDAMDGRLIAPSEAGVYDVRYILNKDRTTIGSITIEVTEMMVSISVPEDVAAGADFPVSWSETINSADYIGVVPMGSDEGERGNYIVVRDTRGGNLTAPSEPGLYEVRYILNEDRVTMGSATIEVTKTALSVTAPEQVAIGSRFPVSWSQTINASDYVGIVPMGADEGERGNYIVVRGALEGSLTAPAEPGLYEVRYILNEGRVTLARAAIELTEPEIVVIGPTTVRAESSFTVTWSETINSADYIGIVPMDADEGERGDYLVVRDAIEGRRTAPSEPGFYEVRYILNEGRHTLARDSFEVVAADAPLDEGAGLSVPSAAALGETITVSWTADSADASHRVTLARADQFDFVWIEAHRVKEEKSLQITLPDEAGTYEVRFLDFDAQSVLGRAIVEVQ